MGNTTILTGPDGTEWEVQNDRLNSWHTITIERNRWHIAHRLDCDLSNCAFDRTAQTWGWMPIVGVGTYRWYDSNDDPEVWVVEEDS